MKPNGSVAARRAFRLHHLLLLFNKFNGKSIVPASHENDTQKTPTNRHHHHCRCCCHRRQRRHGQWRRPRPTVPLFDSVVFPLIWFRFFFHFPFPFHLIMLHFWAHVYCLCLCGFGWLRQMLTPVWIYAVAGMFIGVWPAGLRDMTKWVIFR